MQPPNEPNAPAGGIVSGLFLPEVSRLADLERHLKLPRDLLTEELVTGRLAGRKLAGQWFVHRDAVKAWLNVYGGGR
jgi:hypothetical protein